MRMKTLCLPLLAVVFLTLIAFSQKVIPRPKPQVLNHAFAANGHVQLHLEAGEYEIRPSKEDKIHIEWTAKSSAIAKVKVDMTVNGNAANVTVKTPNNSDLRVLIEVPSKTGMFVRLSAGELTMKGIEGDKDVESHAGDVDLEVGDPNLYGDVDASVKFGDLDASEFDVLKGGIGRSFHRSGTGKYKLHAHLGAGDLRISR